jgi:non-heme chloroperoxidase
VAHAKTFGRAAVLSGVGSGVAAALARARWARNDDPTEGRPLDLPEGSYSTVSTPDGAELSVFEAGPAHRPPIVLIHGWTADKRVWATTARHLLAAGHRVVAYDQRGHGASTTGEAPLGIETLGDDVRVVLDSIDAHDAVLAGHSMGGMAVQQFAIAHKDALAQRVATLVLVSTAASKVVITQEYSKWVVDVQSSEVIGRAIGNRVLGPFLVRSTVGRHPVLAHLRATMETFRQTAPPVRRALLLSIAGMDLTGGLPGIQVPTVVVSGTRDTLTLHGRSHAIAELIPGAELISLPGFGHQLVFEAPALLAEILGERAANTPTPTPGGIR